MDYVVHPEGIFSFTNGTNGEYWWHLKDHLGSVRMTINSEGQIMDCNEYYAFGGFMNDRVPSKNRLLYNSKELQSEAFSGYSLTWYDYGARTLNTDFGRFMSIDPLAQSYYATSPYVYCLNNPVKYVDPDGKKVVVVGTSEYRKKVVNDINQLRRDDRDVNKMIIGLINSPNTHVIKMPIKKEGGGIGEDGFNSISYNGNKADNGIPQGSSISYDPDKRYTKGEKDRTPRVGLAHELTHSEQTDQGKFDFSIKVVEKEDPKNQKKRSVSIMEAEAIRNENKIRKKTGDEKRNKYNGMVIPEHWLND